MLGDDSSIPAIGTDCVHVHMHVRGMWITSILQDVLYISDLSTNLLSVFHLACHSTKVCFIGEACYTYNKAKLLILEGKLRNDLYIMQMHVDGLVIAKIATLTLLLENASETPT
jgi:hypothetical protein